MYVTELAEHCCFEQSRITKSVDQLVVDGFVARTVSVKDRRRVLVSITSKGEKLLVPLVKAAKIHEKKVLAELPREDRARLKLMLGTFVRNHVSSIK